MFRQRWITLLLAAGALGFALYLSHIEAHVFWRSGASTALFRRRLIAVIFLLCPRHHLYAPPHLLTRRARMIAGELPERTSIARDLGGHDGTHASEHLIRWLFDRDSGPRNRFAPRWIFLRALAGIYFSAFLALFFQIRGLIGPQGILPAGSLLEAIQRQAPGVMRFWYAPTLFWFSSSSHAMMVVVWIGLIASVLAFVNVWPRLCFLLCWICFLSFVAAAGDFSGYQSDGMLLEAGFLALFFAPRGLWPGWGIDSPPTARRTLSAAVGMVPHLLSSRAL